ncbi:hypothetical protein CCR94_11730 [Rhodoblastus sphagnicola]|uniref:Pyridoxamine 5'-phosphate oxidase putative domain-containing protein n=1 Tax=Rhodoblastus sphagnicola TaxID=333368 RepID=A0A2S6N803_9HYPH|nr:pyridoxamine 5'-phosphate oxidase family protein [Rhodoblastus sphagnicola]MBB4197806.1 hypothetical protein [Rhodoblastus sphagnicola]PPQ30727.1 hypothetical protein CCR94_11730 [Rhodoblastus sphagnicola]
MTIRLDPDVADLLADTDTIKILATVGADGAPHAVVKQSIHLGEDGNIHYLERLESSVTNKNMVRSIWFNRTVAITLAHGDGRSVQIKGRPVKAHITGELFLRHYRAARAGDPEADLAAVWVIEPQTVTNQNARARREAEAALHPHFIHLDRLARA